MEPKMEQFKNMQSSLEEFPKVKPEAHFDLNDISKKILFGEEIADNDIDPQELIYNELQELEKGLASELDQYRSRGVIGKEEFLITINYFLIAKQNGPDSSELIKVFKERILSIGEYIHLVRQISIPEHTKAILLEVYSKISTE